MSADVQMEFGPVGTADAIAVLREVEFREYGEYVAEILVGNEVQISQTIVVTPPPPS